MGVLGIIDFYILYFEGSKSEGGLFKIIMEEVPGGSLSALLRGKGSKLSNFFELIESNNNIIFYMKVLDAGVH